VNKEERPDGHEGQEGGAPGAGYPCRARALRRDAERNRQRILEAAAEVFAERGLEATLDDVARQAGVGVGTVYRRFPDKASLADALFEERIDTLADMAERAQDQPDAWAALVSFLEHGTEMLADDRGLRQILMFAAQGHDCVVSARSRIRPAIDSLVKRAQADGQVRADLAATDIPIIEFMLAAVAEYTRQVRPALWRRFLPLMLDALRPAPGTATPLAEAEVSADEMVEILSSNPVGRHLARPVTGARNSGTGRLEGDQVVGEHQDDGAGDGGDGGEPGGGVEEAG
jgi:AcrR family transcriptional regulator